MNIQFHIPAALLLEKGRPVTIRQEAERVPAYVGRCGRNKRLHRRETNADCTDG